MKFISLFRCLLVLFTCMFLNQAWADNASANEPKQYQVELIIYSQITPQAVQSEQWPVTPAFQLPSSQYVSLVKNDSTAIDGETIKNQIQLLPRSQFKLKNVQRHLNGNRDYKTIMHIAFRTAVKSPRQAIPIHITGGQYFNTNGDPAVPGDDASNLQPQIDGMMSINVQRYFNVAFNLVFSAPLKQIASMSKDDYYNTLDNGVMHFNLLQNRRMRSKELNYIDYPLYGIVMEIFPVS
ncbi:MAG: CsiV family protein [Coxiellaceae bacterium]|nr:CsiV family protein [Coxiellaceae bacterium]